MSSKFTLDNCTCPLFGRPKNFRERILPTRKDVLLCCAEERRIKGRLSKQNKEPSFSIIADVVAQKLIDLYDTAKIPHVTFKRIKELINALHSEYVKIKSYCNNLKDVSDEKKESLALQHKINDFKVKCKSLFDIASCKCPSFSLCNCPDSKRVPQEVQYFLMDQRNERKCYLSFKTIALESADNEFSQPKSTPSSQAISEQSSNSQKSSEEYCPSDTGIGEYNNHINFTKTMLVAQRFKLSDVATAAVVSSTLCDAGIITEYDKSFVVDKSKVRRDREKLNESLKTKFSENSLQWKTLYFDGRKDDTLIQHKVGNKYRIMTVKEEHISVLSEPNSTYIGHFVPSSGGAEDISNSLLSIISDNKCFDSLEAVGCDGTVTNTGWKKGIIRLLEKKLKRPLQWIICLLHFNELPFRALFVQLDGTTDGPKSFTGEIGKALKNCEQMCLV